MSFDNPIQSEFYGDNVRWFIATVIDASPPFGFEGRVKIRVHGLHSRNILVTTTRLALGSMCSSYYRRWNVGYW